MPVKRIITITGDPGSGKSTAVGLLHEMLPGYASFSAGRAFRKIAEGKGMTVGELTAVANADHDFDRQVDEELIAFGRTAERAIVDSRLAWHFIPDSFKVYLTVDRLTAAARILASRERGSVERYETLEEAAESIEARSLSERNRYKAMYGVDIRDLSNYDFVLDTTGLTPGETAEKVLADYHLHLEGVNDGRVL